MAEEKNINPAIEELKKNINTLKGKLTTLESKKKELEHKANELVKHAIYEKRKEIDRSYDEIIREAEQRLKASEKEKEEEKKKNLGREVEKNTRATRENNIYLNNEIKKILKDAKIPTFVNSDFYMGVWSPSNFKEALIGIITFVIVLLIPTILSFVVYREKLLVVFPNRVLRIIIIASIYLMVLFIFGAIWLFVDKITKKNPNILKEVKEFRKNIRDNRKQIDIITKKTNEEMTDDKFDYTKLDREIEANKIEVENYKKKKQDAIEHFVNVTENDITRSIEVESRKETSVIDAEMEKVKKELSELQKKHDELKMESVK